ncbi:deubiquitinase DESI2 [Drosophila tropicalis]|uniref:deubiquitinase DESI2 n=1 Tax=Drosophila tropicalis TaxID=46794 RepID=UPI0035AC1A48
MFFNRLKSLSCLGGDKAASTSSDYDCDEMLFTEPVILNIYDLVDINMYTMPLGLGVFHSGIQLYDTEYCYSGHGYSFTGILEIQPCNGQATLGEHCRYRESVLLGYTHFSSEEVQRIVEQLGQLYTGDCYHLIRNNCNHFSNSLAKILCDRGIPGWVNRLAHFVACVPFLERCLGRQLTG